MLYSSNRRGNNKLKPGEKFGRLTNIKIVGRDNQKSILWEWQCDCGNTVVRPASLVSSGHTRSCGCLLRAATRKRFTTHGLRHTKIYRVWANMMCRSGGFNASYVPPTYKKIKICKRWKKFINFYTDMSSTYISNLEIDRIDNNGNYEPGNCRWVTRAKNANNKSTSHFLLFNGERKTIKQWSDYTGLGYDKIFNRIKYYGWTVERALTTP